MEDISKCKGDMEVGGGGEENGNNVEKIKVTGVRVAEKTIDYDTPAPKSSLAKPYRRRKAHIGSDSCDDYHSDSDNNFKLEPAPPDFKDDKNGDVDSVASAGTWDDSDPTKPVLKLKKGRFRAPEVGSVLKLKVVKHWPYQITFIPLFELAELSEEYEKMEEDMKEYFIGAGDALWPSQIVKGMHGVIAVNGRDGGKVYKRIKFLEKPQRTSGVVFIEYIDHYHRTIVDIHRSFLFLPASFAKLPPRICALEVEGLHYYNSTDAYDRYVRDDSKEKECVFEGELTAEVQESGKVIIWSEYFPRDKCPYGINGFIIDCIWRQMREPKLPKVLSEKTDCFVVHAEKDGTAYLQFASPIYDHYTKVFEAATPQRISELQGSVKPDSEDLFKSVFLAPHAVSDGTYFRAKTLTVSGKAACVRFMEFGDKADVQIGSLIRANDIHYILEALPSLCVKAHLANLRNLKVAEYMTMFHSADRVCDVRVLKGETVMPPTLAEIVLKYPRNPLVDADTVESINEAIVKAKLAEEVERNYDYKLGPKSAKATKAQVLGNRRRPNDESWDRKCKTVWLNCRKRVQTGDRINVRLSYDKSMEEQFFCHLVDREKELKSWEDDLEEEFSLPWNTQKCIPTSSWTPGQCLLCFSSKHQKVTRCVLKRVISDGQINGNSYWKVYLIDYGMFEMIRYKQFRPMKRFPNNLPSPFGIRAFNKNLTGAKFKDFSKFVQEHKYETHQVVVVALWESKYGEVAEVEWPDSEEGIPSFLVSPPVDPVVSLPEDKMQTNDEELSWGYDASGSYVVSTHEDEILKVVARMDCIDKVALWLESSVSDYHIPREEKKTFTERRITMDTPASELKKLKRATADSGGCNLNTTNPNPKSQSAVLKCAIDALRLHLT